MTGMYLASFGVMGAHYLIRYRHRIAGALRQWRFRP